MYVKVNIQNKGEKDVNTLTQQQMGFRSDRFRSNFRIGMSIMDSL